MGRYDYSKHSPLPLDTLDSGLRPLHPRSHAFRVLKVRPGKPDDPIECNLLVRDLPDKATAKCAYDALSYNWGPKGGDCSVRILVDSDAYNITIRRNLDAALRRLRDKTRPIYLWVDALCVDQENKEEKSAQIPLMYLIYNRADTVRVWLGKEADNSDRAMDFVTECLDLDNFDRLVNDHLASKEWAALSSLMRRPWFSTYTSGILSKMFADCSTPDRRWIIQEIALAKSAEVLCGEKALPWQDFANVISMISKRQSELRQLFRKSATHRNHPDYLGDLSELGAIRLADLSDNLFSKSEDGSIMERLFSLEALMSSLTAFEASDPHDVLYAVLWLAHDAVPQTKNAYATILPQNQNSIPNTPISYVDSPVQIFREPPSAPGPGATTVDPFPNLQHRLGAANTLSPGRPLLRQRSKSDLPKASNGTQQAGHSEPPPRFELNGPEQQPPFATPGRPASGAANDATTAAFAPTEGKEHTATNGQGLGLGWTGPSRSHSGSFSSQTNGNHRLWPRLSISTAASVAQPAEERAAHGFIDAIRRRHIIVDYEKSVFEMCKDFLEFTMKRSNSLDMLCIPWAPNNSDLPSWIPRLKGSAFAPSINGIHRRVNADSLVGRPGHPGGYPKPYRASRGMPAICKFKSGDERCLVASGFVIDVVKEQTGPAAGGTIPDQWLEVGGWRDPNGLPPDLFWRTVVGNRDADGRLPSAYWKKTCQEAFNCRPMGGDVNTTDILYDCSSFVEEFLKRVQRMVWSRKLITLERLTPEQNPKALGLAPEKTQEGDLICILYGCSVPVVLREVIDDEPAAKRKRCVHPGCPSHTQAAQASHRIHYEFVGECYVHGMMEGEAFGIKKKHKIKDREFELR